jgi:hypothetical protein
MLAGSEQAMAPRAKSAKQGRHARGIFKGSVLTVMANFRLN